MFENMKALLPNGMKAQIISRMMVLKGLRLFHTTMLIKYSRLIIFNMFSYQLVTHTND